METQSSLVSEVVGTPTGASAVVSFAPLLLTPSIVVHMNMVGSAAPTLIPHMLPEVERLMVDVAAAQARQGELRMPTLAEMWGRVDALRGNEGEILQVVNQLAQLMVAEESRVRASSANRDVEVGIMARWEVILNAARVAAGETPNPV